MQLLFQGDEGNPIQDHQEGVTIGKPLSDQENDRCVTGLSEEKLRPMPVAIECKSRPCWSAVTHRPEHRQAAQLFEAIAGINKRCPARISILSQEPCGFHPPPLFCLRVVLINLTPLSLIHILSSHLHSHHHGSEIVACLFLPTLPFLL